MESLSLELSIELPVAHWARFKLVSVEVHFTSEQEAKLVEMAKRN